MDCWSGAKILCDFWDTKINTDNIILTTRYCSEDIPGFVADPEEIKKYAHELVNNAHMAATDNKIRDTILINQKFDYLYAENGRLKAVVVDKNGEPQVTDVTQERSYSQCLITDGKGDTLVVSKKGQVMGVKEYKFAGDDRHLLNEYHRQLDSLGEWQINFTPAKNQTYAFDQIGSGNHGIFATDQYYPKSGSYDFRYKSVECGKSDKVKVEFGAYPQADSVIFKDKYGVTLKLSKGNILNFTGTSQADTNYIYAYRGDKKIGKLMLNVYKRKPIKVCLVMVNGAHHKESFKEIKESLDKVFLPAVVEFEILSDEIEIPNLTSFSHGGSGVLTVYNDDQKKVLQAYEKEKKMTDGVYYLFFIDNVSDKKDGSGTPVSGYMPRGYNAGFIYDGGSPHTIAHELGHGIAGLEHVFENSSNSGKTANLMDYANGEELWHFQWDQIQDPSRVWMKWNKDEGEGEKVEDNEPIITNLYWHTLDSNKEGLFVKPDGKLIWLFLKANSQVYIMRKTEGAGITDVVNSALYGFVIADNNDTILAEFDKDSFVRYYHKSNGDTYKDDSFCHINVNSFNDVYIWDLLNESFINKQWLVIDNDKAICIYDKINKKILIVRDIKSGLSWMNISKNEPINLFDIPVGDINVKCYSELELINSDYNPVLKSVHLSDKQFIGAIIGLIEYYPQKVVENATLLMDKIASILLISVAEQIDPSVANYGESEKLLYFKSDANKTVAILLYEFATGTGKTVRTFSNSDDNSFASVYLKGRILKEIYDDFYREISNLTIEEFKKRGIKISLEFSPDQTSWSESFEKHLNSNLPQFFIGGATAVISATDKKDTVLVEISNNTSRSSLILHIADNYDRVEGKIIPLSTITQKIVFELKIDESKFRDR